MIKNVLITSLWVVALYILIRPSLRKANAPTRWFSMMLLLASGVLWVVLTLTIRIPRPGSWMVELLSPFVPVP